MEPHFHEPVVELFKYVLRSTYFLYNGTFYEQVDGVAMGSPLSSVIADFYMEVFEKVALETAIYQPSLYKRYVDDTFVIWTHCLDKLTDFIILLNDFHVNIKFTIELEQWGKLLFLVIMISKHQDGTLGHNEYRKSTHTNLYLNSLSHHHPTPKYL